MISSRHPGDLSRAARDADRLTWAIGGTLVVFYVILGMFIEPISMMPMPLPVAFPMMTSVGLHPVWLGVVLVMMIELPAVCRIDTAATFEGGKDLLEKEEYDVAVLDIMGVKGFDLLDIALSGNIPVLMLTAHALTEDSLKRSAEDGASYFVPKDEMHRIQNSRGVGFQKKQAQTVWAESATRAIVVLT